MDQRIFTQKKVCVGGGGGGGGSAEGTGGAKLNSEISDPVIRKGGASVAHKGLVINYGEGGATKWENRGSETFCATPSRQGKTLRAPPFKEWKLYAPPLQYGYNFKLPRKIYPETFCAPPSEWLKLFPPPLFVGVILHVPPPPVL